MNKFPPRDERFELALYQFSETFTFLRSDIHSLRGLIPNSRHAELNHRVGLAYSQFLTMQSCLDDYVNRLTGFEYEEI